MSLAVGEARDGAIDTIVKLIPGELLVVHTLIASTGAVSTRAVGLAVLAAGFVLGGAVLWLSARCAVRHAPLGQYAVRAIVYAGWAATVDSSLLQLGTRWIPAVAAVVPPLLGPWLFPPRAASLQ